MNEEPGEGVEKVKISPNEADISEKNIHDGNDLLSLIAVIIAEYILNE